MSSNDFKNLKVREVHIHSSLAKKFNLDRSYFRKAYEKNQNLNLEMSKISGILFIKLPNKIQDLIDKDYIYRLLDKDDLETEYNYIYNLSNKIKIGFWK